MNPHYPPGQFIRQPIPIQRLMMRDGYTIPSQFPSQQQAQPPSRVLKRGDTPSLTSKASKQVGANFLPSIINEAYHNVLEQVITALCYSKGFDDIEEGALETLMLIFHNYIKRAGEQSRLACEVAGRTIVTPGDAWFALINMGSDVQKLPKYFEETLTKMELTIHTPEIQPHDQKNVSLQLGSTQPHPSYVFEWMPPFPDTHTYIRTEITNEPDLSYSKVRTAMAHKKRNGVTSLVNYMVRTYPAFCIFQSFRNIIHKQVKEIVDTEANEKRLEEAFISFSDLLDSKDFDTVSPASNSKIIFDKGLITKKELDSGVEIACMCSDGTIIDLNGHVLVLEKDAIIDLEENDKISSTSSRVHCLEAGVDTIKYEQSVDEELDELIEMDSCTIDLSVTSRPHINEMKILQDKITFEYIPEWAHILIPSFERRAYLQNPLILENKFEESNQAKDTIDEDNTPDNPYFRAPSSLE
ncbi:unnamed protein product [Caenorhabditis angaria]|uniref:Transcription initiation factor TFIID subunit 8 n=1 Tax=Caenorhabditis angaria TaxID=860376 RepID=A0A9P1I8P8_9PELO|nr:unnamed protein product [Caenorhabditis angaria]